MAGDLFTFVFTDVEGSTRLWDEQPAEMGPALERHDALLHSCVTDAGGDVVKRTGDGIMAVFASPVAALVACLEAQRGIGSITVGDMEPLRVRMGIHCGEAEPRAGDFFGTAVNRAARIMAAAHGGQILVSGAVASLVRGGLPAETTLLDLGDHRLRDLIEPERLHQVIHPDLPVEFPPPVTLSGRPTNLPEQASEFVGRESEMAAIRSLVGEGTRLLTLIGPGGTGKTRLALQTGADLIDTFPDGVYFVDLSDEPGPESVPEAIQRAVGATVAADETVGAALGAFLARKRMLLILDNFEHVTEAGPDTAGLLATAPAVQMLVTSREPLKVRGEHVLPIDPLGTGGLDGDATFESIAASEAVQLFVERAKAARPDFELTEENAATIALICLRLDGLPLALELAAARLSLFAPGELLARLSQRADVLGSGARDLPARQRTISSTIAWSYEMLDQAEQAVYQALAVFAGGHLDTVESVTGRLIETRDFDVVGVVGSLLDKSLLRRSDDRGRVRVSMLRTIKEFALDRLDEALDYRQRVERAHAECFTDLATRLATLLNGSHRADALQDIEVDLGNFNTAWSHWRDHRSRTQMRSLLDCLWPFHDARGSYAATVSLTRDLLDLVMADPPSEARLREEVALRTILARSLMAVTGYTREVVATMTLAFDLVEESGDAPQRFPVLRNLATLYGRQSNFARAAELGLELVRLADEQDDDAMRCEAHFVVGAYSAFSGDVPTGLEHLGRVIDLFDPARATSLEYRIGPISGVLAFTTSAFLRWWYGQPVQGIELMDRALAVARRTEHPFTIAYVLYHVGFFALGRGQMDRVAEVAEELAEVADRHDYRIWAALASLLQGVVGVAGGDAATGLATFERGMAEYEELETPPVFWGMLLSMRGFVHGMAGDLQAGLGLLEEAMAFEDATPADRAVALMLQGDLHAGAGDLASAADFYAKAAEASAEAGVVMPRLQAVTRLVGLQRAAGMEPVAVDALRAVYEIFEEGFDLPELVEARRLIDAG